MITVVNQAGLDVGTFPDAPAALLWLRDGPLGAYAAARSTLRRPDGQLRAPFTTSGALVAAWANQGAL